MFTVRSLTNSQTADNAKTEKQNAISGGAGKLSFLIIPALACVLLFLVARLCVAHSFPAFLFSEDRKFERFTEQVFREELDSNTLNRHYVVADPAAYKLDKKQVTLGNGSLGARKKSLTSAENYLNTLETFDYEKLSEKHQLTFDIFRDCLETELEGADYLLYDEPLGPTLGIQAQLPVLLAEYTFRTRDDIEDYLTLLSQVPDYFSSILAFEQAKSEEGLFMSDACAKEVISQCREFIEDPGSNYLIEIFNEKIDAVKNLTTDEKIAYKNRNQSILNGYVIPAYETMIKALERFCESGTNDQGLCYYPKGKEYYRWLVKTTVGDDRSIEEIEEAVKVQMVEDFTAIRELMKRPEINAGNSAKGTWEDSAAENESEPASTVEAWSSLTAGSAGQAGLPEQTLKAWDAVITGIGSVKKQSRNASADVDSASADTIPASESVIADEMSDAGGMDTASGNSVGTDIRTGASGDPAAMLEDLREKVTQDFPLLPAVSCQVKYVHESLQDYLSPAFYLSPTIDDYTNNVIYINPASNYSDLELFTTLAHEGYPGHLFQSVYFSAQEPDLLRNLLDVGGYTEGWATYVEMYAYSLWEDDPALAALSQRNRSFTLGLASLLDIGIHYRGYSLDQVRAFLEQLGFGGDTAETLYRTILEAPANYLQYYVGCLNFCSLRDELKQAQGERFSLKEFHRLVLETGPAPFYILRKRLLCSAS